MDRLTERYTDGTAFIPNVVLQLKGMDGVAKKLADYEDLEEQCIEENQCGIGELLLKWKEFFDDIAELYDYRAIGTVSEFRELKEKATAIRANAIDDFLERLCTVCCGESMGVILGNRVKADMLTVDGVCEIAYEIAEAMKGE